VQCRNLKKLLDEWSILRFVTLFTENYQEDKAEKRNICNNNNYGKLQMLVCYWEPSWR